MAKQNKYDYLFVVQGYYSATYGWEDLDEISKDATDCTIPCKGKPDEEKTVSAFAYARYIRNEYNIASPMFSHRIINRRVLKQA